LLNIHYNAVMLASHGFIDESDYGGTICGIDEVGRGCLAGAVYAAAVQLPCPLPAALPLLRDSKTLSKAARAKSCAWLFTHASIGIGIASVEEIDRINILQASLLAMSRAYNALPYRTEHALIDGKHAPALPCPATTLIQGDSKSLSIAAASIVAKHLRDEAMCQLSLLYPDYGFERHAGYGTKAHLAALTEYGITPQHRLSFRPVREIAALSQRALAA
jgi:ribonuclease HII